MALLHPWLNGYYFAHDSAIFDLSGFLSTLGRYLVAVALADHYYRADLLGTQNCCVAL